VLLSGISEKLGIFSAKHRSWFLFDRVSRLAERGEAYFCNVCLPEIGRASPAVFHGLGRKRSHLASAEMVRAEFVKFDQGMIVGSFYRLSGVVICHTSRGWSAFLTTSDQSTANLQPRYDSRSTSGYTQTLP